MTTQDRTGSAPVDRYGDDRARGPLGARLLAVGLAALLLAVVAAAGLYLYRRQHTPEISGTQTGFTIVDRRTMTMRVDVTRDEPSTPVFCILRAKDEAGAEVGRREVFVPPSDQRTVRLESTLVTTGPPVAGDVYGCGADVPAHLDR